MVWIQKEIELAQRARGFHLVTDEVLTQVPELAEFRLGICQLFIKHTSASLALNENADPSVRVDMERHFSNCLAPENQSYYTHTFEGSDDMPAHLKNVLIGSSLMLPISEGALNLGLWQGIYLCEHRNRAGKRSVVITLNGE
ncbi:MAG: hypothetical protein COB04_08610 [Gammaproteobacteria bacterium]|nr:MAG: hypothetical protein COB04_08610 [Gammaproteobacteria bacterium]